MGKKMPFIHSANSPAEKRQRGFFLLQGCTRPVSILPARELDTGRTEMPQFELDVPSYVLSPQCLSVQIFLHPLRRMWCLTDGRPSFFFFVPVQPTVFLHYKFFEDHVNITCSANARPAPVISWKVSGSGIENSTEILSHPNGTTSVTSVLQVKDPKSQVGKEVICQVLHLGTMTSVRQTLDKGKRRWAKMCHTPGGW